MRISRFDVFCLFRKFCRTAMAGNTLLHSRNFQFTDLSMALFTRDVCQQMIVASRQFSPYIPVFFGMAFFTGLKIHGFGSWVSKRYFFVLPMTPGALATSIFCLFTLACYTGLTEYNRRHDTGQNSCYHYAAPFVARTMFHNVLCSVTLSFRQAGRGWPNDRLPRDLLVPPLHNLYGPRADASAASGYFLRVQTLTATTESAGVECR